MKEVKNPSDVLKSRLILNKIVRVEEHLEAMQRDPHSLEYAPWKVEVDHVWKQVFELINSMDEDAQVSALESIKETLLQEKETPRIISGKISGASIKVIDVFLPIKSYLVAALDAKIPKIVANKDEENPTIREFFKALCI